MREYFKASYFRSINMLHLIPLKEGLNLIKDQHNSITLEDWERIFADCSLIPDGRINSYALGFYIGLEKKI